jgi:Escherichia/Staphylococcus phage prohead protease
MDVSQRATLTRETRDFTSPALEFRAEGDAVTFDGIASVVDEPYTVNDMFGEYQETMTKGAFSRTLNAKADVRLLVNHDGVPLARTKSGTLKLSARPDLRAQAELDDSSPLVQGIRSAMERGDMDQMSIGFRATRQEWNDDYSERWIREVELFDVSLVTYPANTLTSASLRSLDEIVAGLTAKDVDPDQVRRAIEHLETLLPAVDEPDEIHPDLLEAMFHTARLRATPERCPA